MDKIFDVYCKMIELLPHEPSRIWTNGDEILSSKEEIVEAIADVFDAMQDGGNVMSTGYYDPVQDERDHVVDWNTGYYYAQLAD